MKKIYYLLFAALTVACLLCGCASPAPEREVHTLFPGNGTYAPQTVYVTLPPETVYVTVPVTGGGADETSAEPVQVTEPVVTTSPETTAVQTEQTEQISNVSYVIAENSIKLDSAGNCRAVLRYPRLSGMENTAVETKINTLFGQITEVDFTTNENCKDYKEKIQSGLTVGYQITECDVTLLSPVMISVRWRAEYTSSDAEEKTCLSFAHTVNLSTGKEIKTKDVFSDFVSVLDLIAKGKATRTRATDGFDSRTDLQTLIANYKTRVAYFVYPPVCFSEESLIVILQSEAKYGGWAEYSIPLDQIGSFLKITP